MKWYIAALFFTSFFVSCTLVSDFDNLEVTYKPEFAVPIFISKTSVQDILDGFDDSTYVEVGPDGIIHLRYQGNVLSQTSKDMIEAAERFILPAIPVLDTFYALPFSAPGQFEVDLASYKSGTIKFAVSSNHSGPINFTLTIPQITKNGQPAVLSETFNAPTSGQYISRVSLSLADYKLTPLNGKIYVRYDARTNGGARLVLPQVAILAENHRFSYVQGYLGNYAHPGQRDIINVEFFENWTQGDVYFENPEIRVHIENSFGIPTRSQIEIFDILTADGRKLPLQSDFITSKGIDFVYPALSEIGQTKKMTFVFNSSNSNIKDVFAARPKALDYKVNAITNPDNKTNLRGFITDSSYYKINVDVDFPMYGRASSFVVRDTFDSEFKDLENVEEVEFKLVADNDIPLDIDGQVYFMAANGAVLDSMFKSASHIIIAAAKVGTDGNVTAKTSNTTITRFTPERFSNLRNSTKMVVRAAFSTAQEGRQSVKLKPNQSVELRMGSKLKFKL